MLLNLAGEPDPGVHVRFDNTGFVPSEDRLNWSDFTDPEGLIHPDLPAGRYWVQIGGRASWERVDIELGPEPFTLDPRPYLEHGTVRASDPAYPLRDQKVRIETRVSKPFEDRYFSELSDIDPDGGFRFVRPAEGTYDVALSGGGTRLFLARDLTLPAGGALEFEVQTVFQQLELSLGGGDAPTGNCDIHATVGDDYVDGSYLIENNLVSFWAPPGGGTLQISPEGGMPFRRQMRPWDFGPGPRPTIELGRWFVQLSYVTPQGVPLHGCTMWMSSLDGQPDSYHSGFGPTFSVYLNAGDYLCESRCSGFEDDLRRLRVDGPQTTTVVMQPEP